MKKKIILSCAAVAFVPALSFAQTTLIAGWDFNQHELDSANSFDLQTFTNGVTPANYSDFVEDVANPAASAFGTLFYDGISFGSDYAGADTFTPSVYGASGNGIEGNSIASPSTGVEFARSSNAFQASNGATSTTPFVTAITFGFDGNAIVFQSDMSSTGLFGENWSFAFAGRMDQGATGSLAWEYSLDGSNYTSLGESTIFSSSDAGYTVSLGALADGSSDLFLRGIANTGANGIIAIDDFGIYANTAAIPEPSTYAAIAGALALAFVAYRRRRS